MPFYEYQCGSCGHHLEAMQKITDSPMRKCPKCGKSTLKKLLSAPVFRLKGSGWYETDFKSDKENKRNLVDDKKEETKVEKKEDKKDDKKEDQKEVKVEEKAEKAEKAEKEPKAETKSKTKAKPVRKGRK